MCNCELSLFLSLLHFIAATPGPNFILFFADDMGYGDLQSYGHPVQERGPIDELAAEGMRFTQWYSAESLCTPSRAALLTGRLPIRSGIVGPDRVFLSYDSGGLPKSEITLAEALKEYNYSTGMVGKWHLGINEFKRNDGNHLPHHHGFDYVGYFLPFTHHIRCNPDVFSVENMITKCFLSYEKDIIEQPYNPKSLTAKLIENSNEFIERNQNNSFFLYMSLPQTHGAMICSPQFCNKSHRGAYGDNMNEMSWAVGQVVDTLRDLKIDNNTLVLFLSDNGPELELCYHAGSTGGLKGSKGSTWDGGIRVPAIAWWPGTIPAGVVDHHVISTMDIFPTLLSLAGGDVSSVVDGISIVDVLTGRHKEEVDPPKHDMLFHYCSNQLMAVRVGRYKIHYYTQYRKTPAIPTCTNGIPTGTAHDLTFLNCSRSIHHDPPLIFDMNQDPGETFPLDPELHQALLTEAAAMVKKHKDTIKPVPKQIGKTRLDLQPCCNPPLCECNFTSVEIPNKDEL